MGEKHGQGPSAPAENAARDCRLGPWLAPGSTGGKAEGARRPREPDHRRESAELPPTKRRRFPAQTKSPHLPRGLQSRSARDRGGGCAMPRARPASGRAAALSAWAGTAWGRSDPAPPPTRRPIPAGPAPGRAGGLGAAAREARAEQLDPPPGPHGGLRRAAFSLHRAPSPASGRPSRCAHSTQQQHRIRLLFFFLLRSKYPSHCELAVLTINNNNLRFVRQRLTHSVLRRLII